jgi:hypothetical protein
MAAIMVSGADSKIDAELRKRWGLGPDDPIPTTLESPTFPPDQARNLEARTRALASKNLAVRGVDRIGLARSDNEPLTAESGRDGWSGSLDAGVRAAADNISLGLANKFAAGADTILPLGKLTNPNTTSVWETGDIRKAFDRNLALQQSIDTVDEKAHPTARFVGNVAGSVVGPVPGRGVIQKAADYGVERVLRAGVGARTAKALGVAGIGAGEGASQGFWHGLLSGGSEIDIPAALAAARDEAGQGVTGALAAAGLVHGVAKNLGSGIDRLPAKARDFLRGGRYLSEVVEKTIKPTIEKTIDEFTKATLKSDHDETMARKKASRVGPAQR